MRCIRHGLCCPTKRASRPSRTPGQRDTEAMQSPGGGGAGGALPQTPEQKYRLIYLSAREMVDEFIPPSWAKLVIVGGDAAYGSKANMRMVQDRAKADTARRWGFVFAITRTWKTVEEKTLKNLVTHLPRQYYQRTQVPREMARKGRRTFWTYHTRV